MDSSREPEIQQYPNDLPDEVLTDILDSEDAKLTFGEMLKQLRRAKGITQEELAEKLDVRRTTVVEWERGDYRPEQARVTEIARVLKLSARDTTLLLNAALMPTKRVPPGFKPVNPYKGLTPFTEEDQHVFFGREQFVQDLASVFLKHSTDADRFLAVTGPSGSGKTSVVQAGLLPCLKRKKACEDWIYLSRVRPGSDPVAALAASFTKHLHLKTTDEVCARLEQSPQGIQRLTQELTRQIGQQVVIIIDQGEELFTQVVNSDKRTHFLDLLVNASTEQYGSVWVIFIFRSDFYSQFQEYDALARLMAVKGHLREVPPLDGDALREVIEGPARYKKARLEFEDDLVNTILVEMRGQAGRLPLLQFTLALLFEHRAGNIITKGSYRAVGGVRGALANHAQQVYDSLPSDAHKNLVQPLFMRLMTIDAEVSFSPEKVTRRRASLEEFAYPTEEETVHMREVINTFVEQRLLQSDQASGIPTIEVSHEILLQEWSLCRTLMEKHSEDIHLLQQIHADAVERSRLRRNQPEKQRENQQRRRQEGKPKDRLYRGLHLKTVQSQVKDHKLKLSKQESLFLHASAAQQTRATAISIAFILLVVISLGIAGSIIGWSYFHPPTLVTTLSDNGPGSLRQAIIAAAPGGTITFDPGLRGTIKLTSDNLNLTKNLTIHGPGAKLLSISNGNSGYIIHIFPHVSVTITGLTFGGSASGLALSASGVISDGLRNSTTPPDTPLDNDGLLTLNECIVTGNAGSTGGGISNTGILTLNRSIVTKNSGGDGAGIENTQGGTVTLNASTVSENRAYMPVASSTGPDDLSMGGGISNSGTLILNNSTVSDNSAAYGGGIENYAGKLVMNNSSVINNIATAGPGGGINNEDGTAVISHSTISGNIVKGTTGEFASGGGIENDGVGATGNGGTITIDNSTISGNAATIGGGIRFYGSRGTVTFCTIYGNRATRGGGIAVEVVPTFKTEFVQKGNTGTVKQIPYVAYSQIEIHNTLVAGNAAHSGQDLSGTFTTGGYNLVQQFSGATFSDPLKKHATDILIGDSIDLRIDPMLRNNGGPTLTHALLPGSPAIDRIPPDACSIKGVSTDQRGVKRPQGRACDVGAYEYEP